MSYGVNSAVDSMRRWGGVNLNIPLKPDRSLEERRSFVSYFSPKSEVVGF